MSGHKKLSREISFEVTPAARAAIRRIARRGKKLFSDRGIERDVLSIDMDLSACHANGCKLDFEKLERADDFNLFHDLYGIACCLDHGTGKLRRNFWPRCALPARLQETV